MKKWVCPVLAVLLVCGMALPGRALGSTNYVVDADGEQVPIPVSYTVTRVIDRVADQDFFDQIGNMYIDEEDHLFVADTGNNRIVRLDAEGKLAAIYTAGDSLNKPGGMYYADGLLYIADTENERVVCVNENDEVVREFYKPESDLLDDTLRFNPSNVALGVQGYVYILKGQNFMAVGQDGEFKGFVGATKVAASLMDVLVRMFASPEQKKKLVQAQPDPYLNFTIKDGLIYAVASNQTAQIRKINMVGDNLYPEQFYGERTYNVAGEYVYPNFISIGVSDDGIISVLEQYSKQVYQYDQDGNMISVFGGEGEIRGRFVTPVSLAVDSKGQIYVADSTTNAIQVFSRTAFAEATYTAMSAYQRGEYETAYEAYERALSLDANYSIANDGIAKCLYKMGRVDEAMEKYRAAGNQAGYGEMLVEYRTEIMQAYFAPIVLAAAVIIVAAAWGLVRLKKYADKLIRRYYHIEDEAP